MDLAVAPAHLVDPARRDQDPLPGPPVAGIDDQVADRPIRVVDQERLDMADVLVGGVDVVAGDVPGALQMPVARSLARVGLALVAGDRRYRRHYGPGDDCQARQRAGPLGIPPVLPVHLPPLLPPPP